MGVDPRSPEFWKTPDVFSLHWVNLSKICIYTLSNPTQQGFVSKRCKKCGQKHHFLFFYWTWGDGPRFLGGHFGMSPKKKNLLVNKKNHSFSVKFSGNRSHPCQHSSSFVISHVTHSWLVQPFNVYMGDRDPEVGRSKKHQRYTIPIQKNGWFLSGWPLVGNEGINLYIGILGIHSLIPY